MEKPKRPERVIDSSKIPFKDKFNPVLFTQWLKQENEIAMFVYPAYAVAFNKLRSILNRHTLTVFAGGLLTFSLLSFVFTSVYNHAGMDFVIIAIAIYFFFSLGQVMTTMHGINVGIRELKEEVKQLDL